MKVSILYLAVCLVALINCQEDATEPPNIGLPDSIPEDFDTDCIAQRTLRPDVCCEPDGSFCCRQCMQGICRCVDPVSGMRDINEADFSEEDNIECCATTPETPEPETETPQTESPGTETPQTEFPETETPQTESPGTETPQTESQETETPQTESPETDAPQTESPETDAPQTESPETEAPETESPETEEPTDDDDEDSESSDSSNSSRSRETSFSDSSKTPRTNTGTRTRTRSESSSTNRTLTRTTATRSRSRSTRSRSTGSRSTGSRSTGNRSTGSRSTGSRSTGSRSTSRKTESSRSKSSRTSISETSGRCPSVHNLLKNGCVHECLVVDSDGCPACNLTCIEILPVQRNEEVECECTDIQECLRTGRFGKPSCVDLPGVGERCGDIEESEDDEIESSESRDSRKKQRREKVRKRIAGASQRKAVSRLNDVELPCQDGLVCVSSADGVQTCQEQNNQGPCLIAENNGRSVDCDVSGMFKPLQCNSIDDSIALRCVCVLPSSGDPLAGTEVIVIELDDAPDCSAIVFENCDYVRAGQLLGVSHGEYFVDVENCRRCLCDNGEATLCEPSATCTALQVLPQDCQYRGQDLQHGDSLQFDCNLCGCRNGLLSCTRAPCQDEVADRCSTCKRSQQGLVCAPNGVTYRSECEAVFCAGHVPFTLQKGACKNYDVCRLYPCEQGEICFHKGGVSCFALDGCDPNQLRLCVDPMDLRCDNVPVIDNEEGSEVPSEETEESAVCGTNGITYPSLCRLIQDTGKEGVAYAGECGEEDCSGGLVCGSDGVTYNNVCELRSQSANALVDYYGQCEDQPGDTPEEVCTRVSRLRRCIYNTSNCKRLVKPEQGCCSLCGGVVLMAIDFRGLGEYVKLNPRLQTLDDLLEVLLESEFIPKETIERCTFEASLTAAGDIQFSLSARDVDTDADFCWSQSEALAQAINSPAASLPEALQFASAAVSASPILSTIESASHSPRLSVVSIAMTLFILLLLY